MRITAQYLFLALTLTSSTLTPMVSWGDEGDVFKHAFFQLPTSASLEDSLRALHLPSFSPKATNEFYERYIFIEGKFARIDSITESQYPELFRPDGKLHWRYRGQRMVGIEILNVFAGDLDLDYVEATARIATPTRPYTQMDYYTHPFSEGSKFIGVLIMESTFSDRLNVLHGASAFLLETPEGIPILSPEEHDRVVVLYAECARRLGKKVH